MHGIHEAFDSWTDLRIAMQIKPAQKPGLKWCCSMCRNVPESLEETPAACEKHAIVSDVSVFVKELNLEEAEEAEEMGAVANTFRGVESLMALLTGKACITSRLLLRRSSTTLVSGTSAVLVPFRYLPSMLLEKYVDSNSSFLFIVHCISVECTLLCMWSY